MVAEQMERVFTPELIQDPYPIYRRLQRDRPVFRDAWSGEMVFTRYEDVAAGLKHPLLSSQRMAGALVLPGPAQVLVQPVIRMISKQMLFSDPPDHTRLRGLANRAFTPRGIEAMRSRIQETADGLLDRLERRAQGGKAVDLIAHFAAWLPVIVIAELLGARIQNHGQIKLWSDDLALFIGGSTQPQWKVMARGARGTLLLRRYFGTIVRKRKRHPKAGDGETGRGDLLGALIAAEEAGDKLTEEELLANAVLLLAAGHETTTNLIGNGVLALLRHPEQLERLRSTPELLGSAVEELLRYESPVQWTGRVAVEELELAGHRVAAGQTVALAVGAANRDPAQFYLPDQLDLSRTDNRHLAFGQGIHFCLGSALARLEGQVALGSLLRRFPELRLAEPHPRWRDNFTLRGLERLPVYLS